MGLLKTAIRDDSPVLIFEHKLLYGSKGPRSEVGSIDASSDIPDEEYTIPLGLADVKREGTDVTVVATLLMLHRSLVVAGELEREGISVEVIDPRTLVPFDLETVLNSLEKTGRLVIVEEDTKRGGWGAEVAASVAEEGLYLLDAPLKRVAAYDVPIPFAPVMEDFVVPGQERIAQAIRDIVA